MSDELYSNYVEREPHPRNAVYIKKWHARLLDRASHITGPPRRVLEVGPGHGYFAEVCRDRGMQYSFCDTSPAVFAKMADLGFSGHLGLINEIPDQGEKYDLIWMSHVLEHSPTWLDARTMVQSARSLLADGGSLVVVSPDILSWRREFWNVDWSHGYPTSVRNVSQLFSDVGFGDVVAKHHRNASFSRLHRAVIAPLTLVPHGIVDRLLTPGRSAVGDGMVYSWKAVFGWRQIMVCGTK